MSDNKTKDVEMQRGRLTRREQFAMAAIQGLSAQLSIESATVAEVEWAVSLSLEISDQLIAELDKQS